MWYTHGVKGSEKMEKLFLRDAVPQIKEIHEVSNYYMKKGVFQLHPEGRPCDVFLFNSDLGDCTVKHDFGTYSFESREGDLVYHPRGCSLTQVIPERSGIYRIDFSFDTDLPLKGEVVTPQNPQIIKQLLRTCASEWQTLNKASSVSCMAALNAIYAEFLKAKNAPYLSPLKKHRTDETVAYIDAHIDDQTLGVRQLAAVMCLSESHVRHSFKEVHGITVSEYIHNRRIRLAKNLLEYSGDSITEIAATVGYSNIYYFSNAFKKAVGCSPSEYRRQKQKFDMHLQR